MQIPHKLRGGDGFGTLICGKSLGKWKFCAASGNTGNTHFARGLIEVATRAIENHTCADGGKGATLCLL